MAPRVWALKCSHLLQVMNRRPFLLVQEEPHSSELKGQREHLAFQSEMPRMIKEKEKKLFSSTGRLEEALFPEIQVK